MNPTFTFLEAGRYLKSNKYEVTRDSKITGDGYLYALRVPGGPELWVTPKGVIAYAVSHARKIIAKAEDEEALLYGGYGGS